MGIHRSETARRRRHEAAVTKTVNRKYKIKERQRRDARMLARVQSGSLPYTPEVMSWLSAKLDKKSSRITDQDIKQLTV
ncbi:MAG: hypothetical protein ACE5GE_04720 [Phycisphaerae bacterium]